MPSNPMSEVSPQPSAVLVAHRGDPWRYPENSLAGYRAALAAGARFLETDVQLSRDGVPVLSHDTSLQRLAGVDLDIRTTRLAQLGELPMGYPERFGDRFDELRIATLDDFASLLAQWPRATAFVEVKAESWAGWSRAGVERILTALRDVAAQCVVISFEDAVVEQVAAGGGFRVGWILSEWSQAARQRAEDLRPDYLFVGRQHLPASAAPLWRGPWRWVVYTVDDRDSVADFLARGFDLIETDRIGELLQASLPTATGITSRPPA